ncbi:energy-coupling factor transporter transmembrane component T family protein [Candidatus Atelocyanobacterium thalassae]|jgi:energy-coupling factor transport system permease protein|uniref:ABC-type cobalt transport system, permease component CbiQ n=1 Tax=Atelocyanobacterium thalassa (isolate ALOHA) TaxID=1453429 RepID=D3EQZ0_ATETH|nr:energy-coupling factor transporter transmembrane component T [Candidatus Atelocyanobacterium thalassa]ADB95890.1 ABC-type cobalt transport system, permease component CbiQ [Candidatus Atelocyanobacterium thalassa isolate ALOHA]MCH2543632.1 energy-coupling factor transporter transmembrane protein EcfT [Candidatus Atelocyanobacterium sp. ALOHA_A2.5_9]|tara:strand:+ start:63578 stop:64429 length:852 start_codon:yes stop_codon:yes gene_type:complete
MKFETVNKKSFFTYLDFRTKLLMIIVVTIITFLWESPFTEGLLSLVIGYGCILAGIQLNYFKKIFMFMIPFHSFILIVTGFFYIDQIKVLLNINDLTPIFILPSSWFWIGGLTMNYEGILYGLNIIFKTLNMVLIIPLGIFTTDVNDMVIGMVKMKIPYKIVFIFSSTLRFFPLLVEEIQSILEAQKLRGLALNKVSFKKKAIIYLNLAVSLILNSMAKTNQIEIVLQSKSFSGSSNRTYLHESSFNNFDYLTISFLITFLMSVIFVYFWYGIGEFSWLVNSN